LEAWFELLHHQLLSVQPASKATILLRKLKMREFLQGKAPTPATYMVIAT